MAKYVLGAAWARRFAMRVRLRFEWQTVRAMLTAGLPFLLINGMHFAIQRMDILFLKWSVPDERIGMYAAASRLIFASLFLLSAVGALLYPVFSRLLVEDRRRAEAAYARGTVYVFLLSALLAQLFITFAPTIIAVLYGTAYAESAGVLQLLSLFVPLFGLGLLASNVLMVSGAVWRAVWASVAALLIGVAASPIAIAVWEIRGAAVAVLLAEGIAAVLYIVFTSRSLGMALPWKRLIGGSVAVALPLLLIRFTGLPMNPITGTASSAISLVLLFAFRVLSTKDVHEMRSLLLTRERAI
jgi:O-antigen/teichoic acid export membrane protein